MTKLQTGPQKDQQFLRREDLGGRILLSLSGKWTLSNYAELSGIVAAFTIQTNREVELNFANLSALDTAGALAVYSLITRCKSKRVEFQGLSEKQRAILDLVRERMATGAGAGSLRSRPNQLSDWVGRLGARLVKFWSELLSTISFLGEVTVAIIALIFRPRRFRVKELFVQLEQILLNAVPVIVLVTGLIGIVVAYLFAVQIEKYGANVFIVDGVAMAIGREISPLIVAVVMAGRSGSAFTAQIGTMKLTQELDAMRIMGLAPMYVLILPRILALIVAMPLLVILGDLVGVLGGVLISELHLGITSATFFDRLRTVVPFKHFVVGVIKAPLFAFSIALIGCRMGLTVKDSARSVGLNTTSTVVQSIVAVILIDAACAVIFMELGY